MSEEQKCRECNGKGTQPCTYGKMGRTLCTDCNGLGRVWMCDDGEVFWSEDEADRYERGDG